MEMAVVEGGARHRGSLSHGERGSVKRGRPTGRLSSGGSGRTDGGPLEGLETVCPRQPDIQECHVEATGPERRR